MKTKAIFFDAGGTLFRPYTSVGQIYADTARRYGFSVSGDKVEEYFRAAWLRKSSLSALESTQNERTWWYELVYEVFSELGEMSDFDAFFDELHELFARPEVWSLFPEVVEVLKVLRQKGYILGIVSNWDSRLVPLCEKMNIHHHFDFILASAVVGSSKPHHGIFHEALKKSGVEPEEAIHIGDSIKDDYEGSSTLGIRALLLDRDGHHTEGVMERISSLNDIFKYL